MRRKTSARGRTFFTLSMSSAKNKFIAAIVLMILMAAGFPVFTASAAVCTSTGTGNWSSAATWSCGYVPTASDDVMIADGTTVTLDVASATVNSLTINDGLDTTGLIIAGSDALTVNQNVYVVNSTAGVVHSINVGAGTLNVGGDLDLNYGSPATTKLSELTLTTGTVTINGNLNTNSQANSQVIFTGAGTLNIGGNFQNGGTLTIGTGTVNYTGAAQSVGSYKYYNLGFSGSGVKTLQAGTTTISGNLILSGTVSGTTAANLAITGNLNVGSGSTLTTGTNFTLGVTGATTIDGTLTLAGTGAKMFTGNLTIDGGGTYNETGVAAITNSASVTNNGTYIANTGMHTISTATAKTIGGTNALTIPTLSITGAATISGSLYVPTALTTSAVVTNNGSIHAATAMTVGAAFTNNGTITAPSLTINSATTNNGMINVSTTLAGGSTLTNAATGVLNFGGNSITPTLTATAAGNVVNYNGAAAQTVKATAYSNLILSGSGVKTMAAGITVSSNLSIAPTGTAVASIAAGANLNPINTLTLGGAGQTSGTWGGTSSGATHINTTYFAATTGKLTVSNSVALPTPTITFGTAPTPTYLGGNFTVSATTTNTDSSTLIYSVVSGPCVLVSGATFSSTGVGTCVVQAYGPATAHFGAAWSTQSITITGANQAALAVASTPSIVVQGYTSVLSATGGSTGGTVTYSVGSSTGCQIDGVIPNQLDVTNASGTCSVTATMAGNANYLPVTSAPLAITMATYQAGFNKSFTPINIAPGGTSQLSITIFNSNLFQLTNAAWSDNLAGVQPGITLANSVGLVNGCGGTVSAVAGGTSLSLSGGTVPPQVGVTNGSCTVTVNVTSTTAGDLVNTIPAGGLTAIGNGQLTSNTTPASATLSVSTVIAPSLAKSFTANTIWAGNTSVLAITITNNDPSNALSQIGITDTLPTNVVIANPPGATLTGAGCSGNASQNIIAVAGASSVTLSSSSSYPVTLAAGTTNKCIVSVNVTSGSQGAYINTIPAGAIQDYQGVTNAALATATLNVQQIGPTKAFAPGTIPAGGTSVATITLKNPTSTAYTNVSLTDPLPANMTVSGTPTSPQCGGTVTSTAASVTLTGGTIPSGTDATPGQCLFTFTVTTPVGYAGTLTNTVPVDSLIDDQHVTNSASFSANLTVNAALAVAKTFSPTSITAGNPSLVTIKLTNATTTAITGVLMTDTLTSPLVLYSTPALATTCGPGVVTDDTMDSPNTVTLTNGTIPASGNCTVTFNVTSPTPTSINNSIAAGGACGVQGATAVCNAAASNTATITISASALPVTGSKAFTPANMLPGTNTSLAINVTAPSDTGLTGVSVTDNLPTGVTVINQNGSGITTNPAKNASCAGGTLTAITGTSTITYTGGSIAANATCTLTVWVTSSTPGTATNDIPPAQITDTQGRTLTSDITANLNVSNLQISKAFYPPTINQNGLSTLTITLTNTNISALTGLSLTDSLPGGVVVASGLGEPNANTSCGGTLTATPSSGSITLTGGVVPAEVGAITGKCTINVDVKGTGAAGTYTNTIPVANVSAYFGSTPIAPIAAATANLVIQSLTITVNKGFNPVDVYGGSSSTLSILLTNPNNTSLTGIAFTDNMPANMIIATPANLNTGTCGGTLTGTPGAGSFSFSGGSLNASGTCTLTLNATTTVPGQLTNTIPAGAVTTFNGASNPQLASASLTNLPGASINKDFSPNPILPNGVSTLTITVQNTNAVPLTDIALTDTLPAGLSVASSPLPTTTCSGTFSQNTWTGVVTISNGQTTIGLATGGVAPNASCTITVPVTSSLTGCYTNTIPADTLSDTEGATNVIPASDILCALATPSLSTTPSASGTVGIRLNDTATLTGGNSPTGTVTFNLYSPADSTCSLAPIYTEGPISLTGTSAATKTGFASNAAGTWHWTADYSGDTNNAPASSICASEPVIVNQANPGITTTATPATGTVGVAAITGDSATLLNAYGPTGSVTFTLYSDASCSLPVFGMSGSGTILGTAASWSKSWTPINAGSYYWQAVYSGDANNASATSVCTSEPLTVGKASPTIGTTLSASSITAGNGVNDSATLSGATSGAGGSVTYTVYTDNGCTLNPEAAGTETVTGGSVPNSNLITFNTAGSYYWQAVYSGDANNASATSVCTSEPLTVGKASPMIGTTLSASSITAGNGVNDSATLSGATSGAGGSVTYTVYTDNGCTLNPEAAGTETVTGGSVPNSNLITFNTAGSYYWQAVYSGDANNASATSVCTSEPLTVGKASPTIGTTLSASSITAGNGVNDSATLSGATSGAGGSVTYTVYTDNGCTLKS